MWLKPLAFCAWFHKQQRMAMFNFWFKYLLVPLVNMQSPTAV
jgi:hypothetical protein